MYTTIRKIGLAEFKDGTILMVRGKGKKNWAFVGGTVENESDDACLIREVKEEIDVDIDPTSIKSLGEVFSAPAHGKENTIIQMQLKTGVFKGVPKPSTEIEELKWFDSNIDPTEHTALTIKVFDWLKSKNYMK